MLDKKWIKEVFFQEIIQCYMLADLTNMEKIYNAKIQCGNCNFPIALQIFACMDFIGWLLSDPKNNPEETKKNIHVFIDRLFSHSNKQLVNGVSQFIPIFRHGLAHEYFAKAGGISRNEKDLICIDPKKDAIILDADILLNEFRLSIKKLAKLIDSNKDLGKFIRNSYNEYITRVRKNYSPSSSGLLNRSKGGNTTTYCVRGNIPSCSGASVAPPSTTLAPQK